MKTPRDIASIILSAKVCHGAGAGRNGALVGVMNGNFVVGIRWCGRVLYAEITPKQAKGIFGYLLSKPQALKVMREVIDKKQ